MLYARKTAKTGYLIMAAALGALGILLILMPETSLVVLCRALGVLLILSGIIKLIGYFSRDLYRLAFQYDLAFGILSEVMGLFLLLHPNSAISVICVLYGIVVLSDGLFKLQMALDAKWFGIKRWWLILMLAVFAGASGLFLVLYPAKGAEVLMLLLGISLLAEGILSLCVALTTIKVTENRQPDIIDMVE